MPSSICALGTVTPLSKREAEMACAYSLRERPMSRAWEYWVTRLTKAGEQLALHVLRRHTGARSSNVRKLEEQRARDGDCPTTMN